MYMDGTGLQLMCCAYSDILSLYFRWVDGLWFGWEGEQGAEIRLCEILVQVDIL